MSHSSIARVLRAARGLSALPYYLVYCPFHAPRRTTKFLQKLNEYQNVERTCEHDRTLIPTIDAQALFPGLFHIPVRLLEIGSRPSGTTCFETYLLAALVQFLEARTIFEFGTSEGRTTLQLAVNSADDAKIYTVDLPVNDQSTRYSRAFPEEGEFRKLPIGGMFKEHASSSKIEQLYVDSATADYQNLSGKIDFVLIDADHSYEYVRSDSENAFSMLSPNGVVLWHDYRSQWRGVTKYLIELAKEGEKKLYHIEGTSLAIYAARTPSTAGNS